MKRVRCNSRLLACRMCQFAKKFKLHRDTPSRLRGNGICVTFLLTVAGPLQIFTGFRYCYSEHCNEKSYLVKKFL